MISSGSTNNAAMKKTGAAANKKHSVLGKLAQGIKGIKELTAGSKLLRRATTTTGGGAEKAFKRKFHVRQGEELAKACECHLWTTAGPISGFLFVSSDKLAFCSLKALRLSPTAGGDDQSNRFHYKVVVPLNKIKAINRGQNRNSTMKKLSWDKYLQVVTKDQFEFWFLESSSY